MSENSPDDPVTSKWRRLLDWAQRVPRNQSELIDLLRLSCRRGSLDVDSLTMIEGVFHVNEMRVGDIMVPRAQMKVILKDADLDKVCSIVVESGHSRFPVMGERQDVVEGILLAKDLLGYFTNKHTEHFQIREHLRRPAIVPESKRLKVLLSEFRRTRSHIAIVVDEYGGVSGLVTIEDVLEQIVGDISDEHDVEEDQYIFDYGDGTYLVKALTPAEEFDNYFLSQLDNDTSDTIGGLVINAFGYLPQPGETVKLGKFLFEVSRADARRIHSLRVQKTS